MNQHLKSINSWTHGAFAVAAFFALLLSSDTVFAEAKPKIINYDAGPQMESRLSIAQFRLWIPPTIESKINGVFIITPGRNNDGRNFIHQKEFQELAESWGFAIMGNFLKGTPNDKDTYQMDFRGATANVLVQALKKFSEISDHNELASAPIFLFGISAGGNVSVQFPGFFPERTIGVAAYVPTAGPGINASKKLRTPMLIAIGAKDKKEWVRFSEIMWGKYGSKSIWTYAKHKDLGHQGRQAFGLGFSYADSVLHQRLVPAENGGYEDKLADLSPTWAGDLNSYGIQEVKTGILPLNTCWLPDEKTAKAWKKYLETVFSQ
ncbi:hypothetical protein [Haloferula sp.]|uniref:hypothetical protein n=1 Tax=Haloferula sp. TaxID=2497595 RepID=UPI003C761395